MPSAAFTIEGGSSPQNVAVGTTVDLEIADKTGVVSVSWRVVGTSDSSQSTPSITPTGTPSGVTASFVMPGSVNADGFSVLVEAVINGGKENGVTVAGYTARGIVGILNVHGYLPFALGETTERSSSHGIINDLNEMLAQSLLASPADPGDDGKIAYASGGNLAYASTVLTDGTYLSIGATPSTIGALRLTNAQSISYRNGTDSGNVDCFQLNASDQILIGDNTLVGTIFLRCSTNIQLHIAGVSQLLLTPTTANFQDNSIVTTGFISLGSDPAGTGDIRLSNNTFVYSSDAASADARLLGLNATDDLLVGEDTNVNDIESRCAVEHRDYVGGTLEMTLTSSALNLATNFLSFGSSPAAIGKIRLGNASGGIAARNAADNASYALLELNASNDGILGQDTGLTDWEIRCATEQRRYIGGTLKETLTSTGVELPAAAQLLWTSVGGGGTNIRELAGDGSPEGVVTADIGSTYRRANGGAGTSFYVKESGTGNTGWTAK